MIKNYTIIIGPHASGKTTFRQMYQKKLNICAFDFTRKERESEDFKLNPRWITFHEIISNNLKYIIFANLSRYQYISELADNDNIYVLNIPDELIKRDERSIQGKQHYNNVYNSLKLDNEHKFYIDEYINIDVIKDILAKHNKDIHFYGKPFGKVKL